MSTDISSLSGSSGFDAAQQRRAEDRKSADFNDIVRKQIDKKIVEKQQQAKGDAVQAQGAEAGKREAMARTGAAPGMDARRFEEALFAKLRGEEGEEKTDAKGEEKTEAKGEEKTADAKAGDAKAPTEGKKTEAKGEAKAQEAAGAAAKEPGAKLAGAKTGAKESAAKAAEKGAHAGITAKSGKADGAGAKDADAARGAGGSEKAKEKEKQGAMQSAIGPGAHHLAAADRKGKGDGNKGGDDKKEDLTKQVAQNLSAGATPHPFALQAPTQAAPAQAAHKVQIPPEIVDKIVDRARFGMNAEGAHEFQIDLKADVFKGLKLKITTKDGKVSIEMIADNADVQRTFEAKAGELAQALAARGLNVTGVHVGLAGAGEGGGGGKKGGSGERSGAGGVSGVRRPGGPGRGGTGGLEGGPQTGKDYTA